MFVALIILMLTGCVSNSLLTKPEYDLSYKGRLNNIAIKWKDKQKSSTRIKKKINRYSSSGRGVSKKDNVAISYKRQRLINIMKLGVPTSAAKLFADNKISITENDNQPPSYNLQITFGDGDIYIVDDGNYYPGMYSITVNTKIIDNTNDKVVWGTDISVSDTKGKVTDNYIETIITSLKELNLI